MSTLAAAKLATTVCPLCLATVTSKNLRRHQAGSVCAAGQQVQLLDMAAVFGALADVGAQAAADQQAERNHEAAQQAQAEAVHQAPHRRRVGGGKARPGAGKVGADPRIPAVGTVITKRYKGEDHQVIVATDVFEYRGIMYKSLNAVLKAVTGKTTVWSLLFFGLVKPQAAQVDQAQQSPVVGA